MKRKRETAEKIDPGHECKDAVSAHTKGSCSHENTEGIATRETEEETGRSFLMYSKGSVILPLFTNSGDSPHITCGTSETKFLLSNANRTLQMTSDPIARLREACLDKERILQSKLQEEKVLSHSLAKLRERIIEHAVGFDQEDVRWIETELGTRLERSQRLESQLEECASLRLSKEKIYEQASLALDNRRRVLEDCDRETSVLKEHPDLLELMAGKHFRIERLLTDEALDISSLPSD